MAGGSTEGSTGPESIDVRKKKAIEALEWHDVRKIEFQTTPVDVKIVTVVSRVDELKKVHLKDPTVTPEVLEAFTGPKGLEELDQLKFRTRAVHQ